MWQSMKPLTLASEPNNSTILIFIDEWKGRNVIFCKGRCVELDKLSCTQLLKKCNSSNIAGELFDFKEVILPFTVSVALSICQEYQ
jgi:hypothetical protein